MLDDGFQTLKCIEITENLIKNADSESVGWE